MNRLLLTFREFRGYNPLMKIFLVLAAMFMLAAPARAIDPRAIEIDWTWTTFYSSFTNTASKTIDPGAFGSVGISTWSAPNLVAKGYSIYAIGGSADFYISHTTKTFSSLARSTTGFNIPSPVGLASTASNLSTTSVMNLPSGLIYNGDFWTGPVTNPRFFFENLSTGATYFVWIEMGRPRR